MKYDTFIIIIYLGWNHIRPMREKNIPWLILFELLKRQVTFIAYVHDLRSRSLRYFWQVLSVPFFI